MNHTLNDNRPFMSIIEASEYLKIPKNTLYGYTSKNLIPYYKLRGRRIYFKKEDLDKFILNDKNYVKTTNEIKREVNLKGV